MRKTILFMIAIAMLLAACSSQPSTQSPLATTAEMQTAPAQASEPTSAQPSPTTVAATTEAPSVATLPPITEQSTPLQPAGAGLVVYKIVPGESQLQYEANETFLNENNRFNTAVGVTPQVEGEIRIDQAAPQNSSIGTITADISQFKSDSGRRDNAIRQRFLESSIYPTVTFVPTSIEGLPETYQEGQEIPIKISGDLTIRDVTKPVTFDAVVKITSNQLTGQATTSILMSDFGFGPISIAGILNTEDQVKVTLTFVARP
jgi:polyisoprenoid-binding protein YceI